MIEKLWRKIPDYSIALNQLVKGLQARALGVQMGVGASIYPSVKLFQPVKISLGAHSSIADYTVLWGGGYITIGDNTMISTHCAIVSLTHDIDAAVSGKLFRETTVRKPIRIGNNVWIGANVTIMPGVEIGDGAVIGAGSVVTHDIASGMIAVGVPARPVRPVRGYQGGVAALDRADGG